MFYFEKLKDYLPTSFNDFGLMLVKMLASFTCPSYVYDSPKEVQYINST